MAENRITPSKNEIYLKLMDIAGKYTDTKSSDFLKTGFFGYYTESMAMMMRDSAFHKSMLYNENFLNTAIIPRSVYNWAKMFNIEVQKATPAHAEIRIAIDLGTDDEVTTILTQNIANTGSFVRTRYGEAVASAIGDNPYLILDKEDPILAGDYYFSLEHSILIYAASDGTISASYITSEYSSTEYQALTTTKLTAYKENGQLIILARAYQYRRIEDVRSIVSSSFLNKTQEYEFEGQFCGVKLFYVEGSKTTPIDVRYSTTSAVSSGVDEEIALYNLTSDTELQLVFKNGDGYFMPAPNTILRTYIYVTEGANVPTTYKGIASIVTSSSAIQALSISITFDPTDIIGGKNAPSLNEIKSTIIRDISTRKTITTQADLENYFSLLTTFIADVNNGELKFIKQRDDILRRLYNTYILLRDNTTDDGTDTTSYSFLSPCVPTNTIDMTLTMNKDDVKFFNPECTENGVVVSPGEISHYECPFRLIINTTPVLKATYLYDLINQTSGLSYARGAVLHNTEEEGYCVPIQCQVVSDSVGSDQEKEISFIMKFNTDRSYTGKTATVRLKSVDFQAELDSYESGSSPDGTASYTTTATIRASISIVSDSSKNAVNITPNEDASKSISVNASERLTFNFSDNAELIGASMYTTDDPISFFTYLDDVMDSKVEILKETDDAYTFKIYEVPVVRSTFIKGASSTRRINFMQQLLSYIKILKENLALLETSTFFNIKFFNTYGVSHLYDTATTNLNIALTINLVEAYKNDTALQAEIRSYVRRVIDKMNKDGKGVRISTLTAMLTNAKTYGQYIDHIDFAGMNDSYVQFIEPLDVSERNYPPEWLNIQPEVAERYITFE